MGQTCSCLEECLGPKMRRSLRARNFENTYFSRHEYPMRNLLPKPPAVEEETFARSHGKKKIK